MTRPIGGRVFINVGGERLDVRGNVTSNVGQIVMRETVVGADRVHGFTENVVAPFIQCDLSENPAFPLSSLNEVSDTTVTAELADGRTLVLRNAWQEGDLERNSSEGSIGSVRFVGMSGEEVGAA